MPRFKSLITATVLIAGLLVPSVHAGMVFVSSRADLGGNDLIDWGQLGTSAPNPFSIASNGGLDVTVLRTNPFTGALSGSTINHGISLGGPGNLEAGSDYINGPSSIRGSFGGPGTVTVLTLDFAESIQGAGADFDVFPRFSASPTLPADVSISSFDSQNVQLSSFNVRFISGDPQFLGVRSDTANIDKLIFQVSYRNSLFNLDTASTQMNEVSLITSNQAAPSAVPEPASFTLLCFGAMGLSVVAYRRRRRVSGHETS